MTSRAAASNSDGGRGFLIEWKCTIHGSMLKQQTTTPLDRFVRPNMLQTVNQTTSWPLVMMRCLYTKASEWDFEKEWRIIRNFNDAVKKMNQVPTAPTIAFRDTAFDHKVHCRWLQDNTSDGK